MDAFDTASPEFASPEMTEARAEVNDAAVVNDEGQIAPAPGMPDMPPVAPDMAAGTPEGAMEMSGGGESAGMGAMEGAFAPPADTAAPADDALGSAMDQAMDPGAPAPGTQPAMDETAGADIVDPGMGGDQAPDDDGGRQDPIIRQSNPI
jgi:hypothetical protein